MELKKKSSLSTQQDFQRVLAEMNQQNYRELHPDKFRKTLHDYFIFLELSISWLSKTTSTKCDFSITELEGVNQYLEAVLRKVLRNQQRLLNG